MEILSIEGSAVNPNVLFNPEENHLEISGYSRPENARDFYMALIQWIEDYKVSILKSYEVDVAPKPVVIDFKFIYFNSSSAKFINDILLVFSEMHQSNIPIEVNWFYDQDDDELREAGEEFSDMCNLPFNYVEVTH
jgi:hypothetical protein